jgi:hypothetical protein
MYSEVGATHRIAHFHAEFGERAVVYAIDPVERVAGSLPRTQQRLVEAWAELHQRELLLAWRRLENGLRPDRIEPLR